MGQQGFEIVLANTAGFCMGVRRAVRMVLDAASDPRRALPIKTPGPLIHNRQVLEVLERQGVLQMNSPAGEWQDGQGAGTAVVRAHGLTRSQYEQLQSCCEEILDATCPHVSRVQEIVRDYASKGYLCVVVGDAGHAEVDGVLSYAADRGHVVGGPDEVSGLPDAEKVAVVAQTTQDEEVFAETVERVKERYQECVSFDTICRSTQRRQTEVRELAGDVDAMIVVGGLNSANTRRLAAISAAAGTPTFHVETEDQLDIERVLRYRRVGLTAGASTPNWMIKRIIHRLLAEYQNRTHPVRHMVAGVLRGFVNSGVYAAGGAAALTYASAQLLPQLPHMLGLCMAVSFLFVLSQHVFNQYGRRESLYLSEPERAAFFSANEATLMTLGVCSLALSLFLSAFLGWHAFALVVFVSLTGLVYRVRLPRSLATAFKLRSINRLAGSRELFTGIAWATLVAVVPVLDTDLPASVTGGIVVAFGAVFVLVTQRTLILGLGAAESDQLIGRETLVGYLGLKGAQRAVRVLGGLLGLILLGGGLSGIVTGFVWLYLLAVPFILFAHFALMRSTNPDAALADALSDGVFYWVGLLGALWAWQQGTFA